MAYCNRKNPRLPDYDYDENGAYFITICTHNRKQILSHIVGSPNELPVSELTPYGLIADSVIQFLPQRFHLKIDTYVIMPNHIHLLILIDDPNRVRAIRESPLQGRSVISQAVGYLKMNVSKQMHQMGYPSEIWQRSFHDHIIRDQRDYDKIWMYISDNPRRWQEDCFYCNPDNVGAIHESP